jgi:hypothetical protein
MNPRTRHKKLLQNDKVRRWYENLEARSQVTAEVYLRNFGMWTEYLNTDPDSIIGYARDRFDDFKAAVSDQIRKLERNGVHGSSISTSIKPMISYLKFNNVIARLGINIKNENRNLNAENEMIPKKDQLSMVMRMASLRERVSISLMAFSGLRSEVLGSIDGKDGLRISDIPDIAIHNDGIEFLKSPIQIKVRFGLSKTRMEYFTFLGEEGMKYIKEYLDDRIRSGGRVTPESAVILPEQKQSSLEEPHDFLLTTLLLRRIKYAITKAGFNWRPYIFRAYFGTNLDRAESKGLISNPWRQFIMGHKGDIEETYTKRKLDPVKIDEGREAYRGCLKFLETENKGIPESEYNNQITEFKAMLLKLAGYMDEEIEKGDILNLDNAEIVKKIDEKKDKQINNGNSQKVVSIKR